MGAITDCPAVGAPVAQAAQHSPNRVCDIPSLDGLRAFSIFLVVLAHCYGTKGFSSAVPHWVVDHGTLGVQIFFVISGFLITSLLLREKQNTGSISLKCFYARRSLRIFPAFYLFFLAMVALSLLGVVELPRHNLLHAATYTMNYASSGTWWMGHLWSLSVEEQFYFVWPTLMCLIGARAALWSAACVAIGAPVVLGTLQILHLSIGGRISMWFPFVADSIATGCVLAGALPFLQKQTWFLRTVRGRLGLAVPLGILLVDYLRPHPRIFLPLGECVLNLGIAYCIARFTAFHADAAGRLLNCRAMVFVGGLSYSLYLWQQPFLNHYSTATWTAFPLNCCCALSLACVSYFLVERPFLRLRKRFQPVLRREIALGRT